MNAVVETEVTPATWELVVDGQYGSAPREILIPSKTNRKRFNESALAELAVSIKKVGIAQAILVRPHPSEKGMLEIVCGERRWRAAEIAGLTNVPIVMRNLTDAEALELQIVENLQREDVHPIEEAESYELLMSLDKKNGGMNADEIAAKFGKSRSYVYGRLKLLDLCPDGRAAVFDGKLNASVALLVARIPVAANQMKALEEIQPNDDFDDPMSYQDAKKFIARRFTLDLTKASFPIHDAKLVKAAGSCETCPKRTGCQPVIYADVSADVCTDPDCFESKRAAFDERRLAEAKKSKIPIYTGEEAEDRYESGDFATLGDDIDFYDRVIEPEEPRSDSYLKDLLKDEQRPTPVAYVVLDSGIEPLFDVDAMQAALEAAGLCETEEALRKRLAAVASTAEGKKAKEREDQRAEQVKRQQEEHSKAVKRAEDETAFRTELYNTVRSAIAVSVNIEVHRLVTRHLVRNFAALPKATRDKHTDLPDLLDFIKTASSAELDQLIMDVALGQNLVVNYWQAQGTNNPSNGPQHQALVDLAKAAGVNDEAIRHKYFPPADHAKSKEKTAPAAQKAEVKGPAGKKTSAAGKAPAAKKAPAKPKATASDKTAESSTAAAPQASATKPGLAPNAAWPFPKSTRP